MTGNQSLDVLIGIAAALLLIWLLLIAVLAGGRPKGKGSQLAAAYRRFSSSGGALPSNRRLRPTLLVLAVLVILNVVWLGLLLSRAPGERAVESTSTRSATPADCRRALVRHQPPTLGTVRPRARPFRWRR